MHRLLNLVSAVSLLVGVAVVVLWSSHLRRLSRVNYKTSNGEWILSARPLGIYLGAGTSYRDKAPPRGWEPHLFIAPSQGWHFTSKAQSRDVMSDHTVHVPGFYAGAFDAYQPEPDHMRVQYVLVGYPWLILMSAVLPAIAWGVPALQRRNRKRGGRCLACGYSLVANTSGVCPECGIAVIAS
jgi:hypothetical protein